MGYVYTSPVIASDGSVVPDDDGSTSAVSGLASRPGSVSLRTAEQCTAGRDEDDHGAAAGALADVFVTGGR